jgi:hypothetical protein
VGEATDSVRAEVRDEGDRVGGLVVGGAAAETNRSRTWAFHLCTSSDEAGESKTAAAHAPNPAGATPRTRAPAQRGITPVDFDGQSRRRVG